MRRKEAIVCMNINGTTEAKIVPHSEGLENVAQNYPKNYFLTDWDKNSLQGYIYREVIIFIATWSPHTYKEHKYFRVIDYVIYSDEDFEIMLDEITDTQTKIEAFNEHIINEFMRRTNQIMINKQLIRA